jgi:hypothetical protein
MVKIMFVSNAFRSFAIIAGGCIGASGAQAQSPEAVAIIASSSTGTPSQIAVAFMAATAVTQQSPPTCNQLISEIASEVDKQFGSKRPILQIVDMLIKQGQCIGLLSSSPKEPVPR